MGLDIRWPIGLMFTLIGVLLTGYGIFDRAASLAKSGGTQININLIWGVVLLIFGILMLLGAMSGKKKNPPDA
jgi:hypothetical protein